MSNFNELKKQKKLSIDELKKFKGFENITDEESKQTIETLEKISNLFYDLYLIEEKKVNDEKEEKSL
jgi:hypothetical protein